MDAIPADCRRWAACEYSGAPSTQWEHHGAKKFTRIRSFVCKKEVKLTLVKVTTGAANMGLRSSTPSWQQTGHKQNNRAQSSCHGPVWPILHLMNEEQHRGTGPDLAVVSGMPYVATRERTSLPDASPTPPPDTARSCRMLVFANPRNALVESGTWDGHATFAGQFHGELCGKREKNRDHKQRKSCAQWALIHQPAI